MNISSVSRALALCLGACSSIAWAQQDVQNDAETEQQEVEVINVTGSFIRGVDLEGAQPLTVIDSEDIRRSGANNLADLLTTINQMRGGDGTFTTAESGATSTSTPAGQAAASLRGLGPASTLTLINGRRIAASSFASGTQNFVDINSIPLAAIERIEILATGASATYGADAVAGVINYILKKDYQGAELNLNYGNSTAGSDDGRYNLNLIWGKQLETGHLTLFADYFDRNPLNAQDREQTRTPLLVNSYSYLPKGTPNIYFNSARDGNEIGSPDCATPFVTTEFGEDICAYYNNEDDYLETPFESLSAGAIYTLEMGDLTWHTDLFFSHTKSTSFSRPAPIDQVDDREGPFVPTSALFAFDEATREDLLSRIFIDPFDTPAGRELEGFRFDARFNTPRTIDIETDSVRLVTSLAGVLGEWEWESGLTYSRSDSDQVASAGIYNRFKYHAAIAGELCADGSIANFDGVGLSCATSQLLGVYNPFLQNSAANENILAVAQERPTREGESTVYGFDFRASGDVIEFGDDTIKAAVGIEVRREEINDIPSENARARFENGYLVDVFGFGSSLSEADRNQWGAFAEFFVPLTEELQLQVAGRYDDYNDFGDTFNPKVALTYRPTEELILRASWSTAFRAPSLTQAGVQLRTTSATFDCAANQAVADLYCEGDGTERNENVLELGNALLEPEESESISLGFGFSPTEDTNITLDYWYFDHEDLVDTDMTGVLARAINDASLRHCGLVPTGEQGISYLEDLCLVTDEQGLTIEQSGANLTQILDAWILFDDPRFFELPLNRDHVLQLENTGNQTVSGIDLAVDHTFRLQQGTLTFALDATHYLEFDRNRPGSDEIEELVGTWRFPRNVASLSAFWDAENFFVGLTAFYTDSYEDDIEGLRGRELDELLERDLIDPVTETRDVSSWTTVRASMGYFFEDATVRLTVDNLFDRDAPLAYGTTRGFDSINHDVFGTTYNLSMTVFF